MPAPQFQSTSSVPPSYFNQQNNLFPKFLDGSFNNNKTIFSGKTLFSKNETISLDTKTPQAPSSKLLNNWFNGNSTTVKICPR